MRTYHKHEMPQVAEFEIDAARTHEQHTVNVEQWHGKVCGAEQQAAASAARDASAAEHALEALQARQADNKMRLVGYRATLEQEAALRTEEHAASAERARLVAAARRAKGLPRVEARRQAAEELRLATLQERAGALAAAETERDERLARIRSLVRPPSPARTPK